jgi:hypothetical protein
MSSSCADDFGQNYNSSADSGVVTDKAFDNDEPLAPELGSESWPSEAPRPVGDFFPSVGQEVPHLQDLSRTMAAGLDVFCGSPETAIDFFDPKGVSEPYFGHHSSKGIDFRVPAGPIEEFLPEPFDLRTFDGIEENGLSLGRRKNRVPKGFGPEGRMCAPHSDDNHNPANDRIFVLLNEWEGKIPRKVLVVAICKLAVEGSKSANRPIENFGRWQVKRLPCAYAWLARNCGYLSDDELEQLYRLAKGMVAGRIRGEACGPFYDAAKQLLSGVYRTLA